MSIQNKQIRSRIADSTAKLVEIQQELAVLTEQLTTMERIYEEEVEEIKKLVDSNGSRFRIFERAMAIGYYDIVLERRVHITLCFSLLAIHFEHMNQIQQLTFIERIIEHRNILGYYEIISIIEYLHEEPIIVDFLIKHAGYIYIEWVDYNRLLARLDDAPSKSRLLKKLLTEVCTWHN